MLDGTGMNSYKDKTQKQLLETKLEKIRDKIQKIDQRLLSLIKDRMELAEKIAEVKQTLNLDIYDAGQEEKVKRKYKKTAVQLGINEKVTENICKLILKESKKVQKRIGK